MKAENISSGFNDLGRKLYKKVTSTSAFYLATTAALVGAVIATHHYSSQIVRYLDSLRLGS